MPKIKNTSKKYFNQLDSKEKIKELGRMAKRANVRIALLEKEKQTNELYKNIEEFNKALGRKRNRFYEGTKYETQQDINETFKVISSFLNDKRSTLSGIQSGIEEKLDKIISNGNFDYKTLLKLTEKEKKYISKKMAMEANKRLKKLEDEGMTQYAYKIAEHYNNEKGRKNNRFYRGMKFDSIRDLNIHIQNMGKFLNAKTSTPKGVKDSYDKRIKKFKEKGVKIEDGKEKEFFDFLASKQFQNLRKYGDSDQVIETYVDARNADKDIDEINEAFTEYMNDELDLSEVQEKLKIAKWQQGGLLH